MDEQEETKATDEPADDTETGATEPAEPSEDVSDAGDVVDDGAIEPEEVDG